MAISAAICVVGAGAGACPCGGGADPGTYVPGDIGDISWGDPATECADGPP